LTQEWPANATISFWIQRHLCQRTTCWLNKMNYKFKSPRSDSHTCNLVVLFTSACDYVTSEDTCFLLINWFNNWWDDSKIII